MANPKIMIEVDTYLGKTDATVQKYVDELQQMQKQADKIDLSGNISKEIQGAIDDLKSLKQDYSQTIKTLANEKLDTKAFDNFTKEINSRMDEISKRVADAEGVIQNLQTSVEGLQKSVDKIDLDKFKNSIKSIRTSFNGFKKDIKTAVDVLYDFQKVMDFNLPNKKLAELNSIAKEISNIDLFDFKNIKQGTASIAGLQQRLAVAYENYLTFQKVIENKDSKPSMIENAEQEIAQLLPSISETIKRIAALKKVEPSKIFELDYDFTNNGKKYNFNTIINAIDDSITNLKGKLEIRRKELKEETESFMSTTASSFTLDGDGIKIPVVLDKQAMNGIKDDLKSFINEVSAQTENNPINIMVRFFPLKTTKAEAKEVEDHIKDIRAQIPKLENKDLSNSLNGLVDNLEKEYQKALVLKIKVEFSEDLDEIKRRIKLIENAAKDADIVIKPTFKVSDEEASRLNEKLEEISKNFVTDFDQRITKMSDSLNRLFSEGKVENWSEAFNKGLDNIDTKLQNMKDLLVPLSELYSTMSAKKKVGRPSEEFLKAKGTIDKFTETIDALHKSLLDRENAPSLNPEKFTQEIQKAIDGAGVSVQIPVEPADVESFVEQIEDELGVLPINLKINGVSGIVGDGKSGGNIIINTGAGTTINSDNTDVSSDKTELSGKKEEVSQTVSPNTYQQKLIDAVGKEFIDKEFANVFFGGYKNKPYSKEEALARNEFNGAYNSYIATKKRLKKNSEVLEDAEKEAERLKNNKADEAHLAFLVEKYPMLEKVNKRNSKQRKSLLSKFLNEKGIEQTIDEKIPNVERKAIKDFHNIYNKYLSLLGSIEGFAKATPYMGDIEKDDENYQNIYDERQKEIYKKLEEKNIQLQKHIEENPILEDIQGRLNSGDKDKLIRKYLKSRGIDKTASISAETYFRQLSDEVVAKGDFPLSSNKKNGVDSKTAKKNKADLENIVNRYIGYKAQGGALSIDDLTENPKARQKIKKAFKEKLGFEEEIADQEEEVYVKSKRKSQYDGISDSKLRQKISELNAKRKEISEQTTDNLISNTMSDMTEVGKIINKELSYGQRVLKDAQKLEQQGLIEAPSVSYEPEQLQKMGYEYNGRKWVYNKKKAEALKENGILLKKPKKYSPEQLEEMGYILDSGGYVTDATEKKQLYNNIKKNIKNKYGVDDNFFENFENADKTQLARELLAKLRKNQQINPIDQEIKKITQELETRKTEKQQAQEEAKEKAQKKNKQRGKTSKKSSTKKETSDIDEQNKKLEKNIELKEESQESTTAKDTSKTKAEINNIDELIKKHQELNQILIESTNRLKNGDVEAAKEVGETAHQIADIRKQLKKQNLVWNEDTQSFDNIKKSEKAIENETEKVKENTVAKKENKKTTDTSSSTTKGDDSAIKALSERIQKYGEEEIKIKELKELYKEYDDALSQLDQYQGSPLFGSHEAVDADDNIRKFFASQLTKHGYKFDDKKGDFVKNNRRIGFGEYAEDFNVFNLEPVESNEEWKLLQTQKAEAESQAKTTSSAITEEASARQKNTQAAKEEANAVKESNKTKQAKEVTTTPSVINEITQAEDRMGNEAQEATNQAKQGLAEMRKEAEILKEILSSTFYRGVSKFDVPFETNNTFTNDDQSYGTTNIDIASDYAGYTGKIFKYILDKNAKVLHIPNNVYSDSVSYLGEGQDAQSQEIISLVNALKTLEDKGVKKGKEIDSIIKKIIAINEDENNIYGYSLEKYENKYKGKTRLKSDDYGIKARNVGYDAIAFSDMVDSLDMGDVVSKYVLSVLNTAKIKILEEIPEFKLDDDALELFPQLKQQWEKYSKTQSNQTPVSSQETDSELSLTERQIEVLDKEAEAIINNINAKGKDKTSTEELIESYEKLMAIDNALIKLESKLGYEPDYSGQEVLGNLNEYINMQRGVIQATASGDKGKPYWYELQLEGDDTKFSPTPVGEKFGQDYIDGILSTVSETREVAAELPKNAKDATADAQQSNSPAKVSETLGEYWGEGYADGILNTQAKVKNAVRALVETAKLTMDDLRKDIIDDTDTANISKIVLDEIYAGKNPTKMTQGFIGHIQSVDKTRKQQSTAKGQLTKLINQLNNSDTLPSGFIDKADSKFDEWIQKAEKLGVDVDKFRKAYSDARSKFVLDGKYTDEQDAKVKDETKYKVNEEKNPTITDPKEKKKVVGGLLKDQKQYYAELLGYEKKIADAQLKQDDELVEHYKKQRQETESLYNDTSKQLNALADEKIIQQQELELSKLRRKNEAEIADIIAKRVNADKKSKEKEERDLYFKEAEARNKQKAVTDKEIEKRIADVENNNLRFSADDVQRVTHIRSGVTKKNDWEYSTEGDKWTGALQGYDEFIGKFKELIRAEEELDRVFKEAKNSPELYADVLEEAKNNVYALRGEIRDLGADGYLESFTDEQLSNFGKLDDKLSEIYRKREVRTEMFNQKQADAEQKANDKKIADEEKAQEKYNQQQLKEAQKRTDTSFAKQQKAQYDELASKVKEYINLRKTIAQGKGLDGDIDRVKDLEDEIVDLNVKLKSSPFFNGDLEMKATKGLSTIEEEVRRIEEGISRTNQEKLSKQYQGLQGKLASAAYDIGFELDNGKPTEQFRTTLSNILEDVKAISSIDINTVTEEDISKASRLLEEVRQIRKEGKLASNRTANENSIQKNLSQVNSILSGNTKRSFKRTDVYRDLVDLQNAFKNFDTSRPQSELAELTTELLKTKARFEDLDNTVKGKNLFQTFIERLHGTTAQLVAQYLSWMDIIRYARTMFNTIRELDTALVDLRKTTSMNVSELNEFYRESTEVGKQLGVTSQQIIQQAADWSRLGYSTKEQATTMAELSSKFASISPGMTTENSTDYLVSTMKAFGIETDKVERQILDNVNRIGKILPKHMVTYGAKLLA